MTAYIKAISYYLPENILSNIGLNSLFSEWAVEKIANKIGIEERHIAAKNEFASDMAISAAKKLFDEHQIQPTEIDFILYCTQSPDYYLPSTSCIIQDRLNIPKSSGALDFNLGCSGYVYGLALAKGLVSSGIARNILLLTSETYSKYIHDDDKGNRTVFGDAASASLISYSGFAEIKDFVLGTDGKGAENLMVKNGGIRNQFSSTETPDNYLYMDGPEIFGFTIQEIPKLIEDVLVKNQLQKDEINLFVFHQANRYILEHLRKKINVEEKAFYYYMEKVGNTVSSTIPIALYHALKEKKLTPNENWLLAGFGVGYSWAATILNFK